MQVLRRPGKQASVCLDGYLGMNFAEEDEYYSRRYVIHNESGEWETEGTTSDKR